MAQTFKSVLLLTLPALSVTADSSAGAPFYTAESIASSAANIAGYYTPNSFLTIYGRNLAYVTKAIGPDDLRAGQLPTALAGTGVRVLTNQILTDIYFVSPNQVNLLIPPSLKPGPVIVQLVNDSLAGPPITIMLSAAAPVFFETAAGSIVGTHGNGPLITATAPAKPGEVVVLYATGLGLTAPPAIPNQIPQSAAPIADRSTFRLLLNGTDVDLRRVEYAGLTPGFAGLYQINLRLPDDAPPDPEVRIGFGDQLSPPGRVLSLQ